MNLEALGYGEWHANARKGRGVEESRLARVTAVDRERYMIAGPNGVMPAEASGKLVYHADAPEDMPCVGDWVVVEYLDNNEHAIILDSLPRRTVLRRRAAGARSEYQAIAANIDVAFIVQSCDVDFNLNRLDRYIVMARDGGITPRLLLTKSDLVDEKTVEDRVAAVTTGHSLEVMPISSASGAGFDTFLGTLRKGETYCLIGSSGVGKSTILNRILGREELETAAVSARVGKGRHTTTRRQLVLLENGALFIDTPGMRELGMMAFETGLNEGFEEIAAAAESCRYADCTHTREKGCAVIAMVASGQLSEERYRSYLKLQKESRHYEMGYLEKRKKDRAFGKMLKSYEKSNRKT